MKATSEGAMIETTHALAHVQGDFITLLLKEHCRQFNDETKVVRQTLDYLANEGFLRKKHDYQVIYGLPT